MIKVSSAAHQTYYPITGVNFRPAWEFAVAHRWPVLIHSGPRTEVDIRPVGPCEIGKVAAWYPDANFVISHCGAYDAKETWEASEEAIGMALRHDNVYLNFNTLGRYYGIVDYLVQRVGSDKVSFGTDGPGHCFAAEIGHVAYAKYLSINNFALCGAD